ncbi:ABC transporter permease [Labrys wisconsinensis]|uniref:Ribose transport system permease protein n=1 Tax=Labrys wisconsinensis TaxID=425677 RepID=A0ABU0JKS8_9HYPH|nr:ABC transporter permease [Labrys wisconsinensis]MDQ0474890.1 ribose transport system permease protein [Labrys wisconsinensis]
MTSDTAPRTTAVPAPPAGTGAAGRGLDRVRKASVAVGCVLLFAVFAALSSSFYQPSNLVEILLQSSINAIVAVGMTLVVMTKGIDLSVGSIVGLSSMVMASLVGHGIVLAVAAGIAVGIGCGLFNGVLIAKLKLPDFIVTLGTMSVYRGFALIYTNGQPIYGIDRGFRAVFAGEVAGVPTPVLIALAVALVAFLMVRFTALGEHIVAVGGNEEAARLSGINVDRVKICVYAMSGGLSALAGFILVARIGAAEPIGGSGFELQAIGAAVIGGASLFGGEGNPLGSLVGAITLGAMRNGLTLLNVPSFWQFVATGAVVILAVFADQVTRRKR